MSDAGSAETAAQLRIAWRAGVAHRARARTEPADSRPDMGKKTPLPLGPSKVCMVSNTATGLWHGIRTVALSRLQERISLLSSKAVTVDDPEEFNLVFAELRNALRGQLSYLREMVDEAKRTISQLPGEPRAEKRRVERRKSERRKSERRASN